jgi:hypothetical protein
MKFVMPSLYKTVFDYPCGKTAVASIYPTASLSWYMRLGDKTVLWAAPKDLI